MEKVRTNPSQRWRDAKAAAKWAVAGPFWLLFFSVLGLGPLVLIVVLVAAAYGAWDLTGGRVRRLVQSRRRRSLP
jgi:hypothetical protein